MTEEMQKHIEDEIESAIESGDQARIQRVMARSFVSMVDCQRKTADRVKVMKSCQEECVALRRHEKEEREEIAKAHEDGAKKGAKLVLEILKGLLGILAGGGGVIAFNALAK